MKSASHIVGLLGLLVILLLAGEAFLLFRSWSGLEDLRIANQRLAEANNRLEGEMSGLKLSEARINALFTRLNESVVRSKNAELSRGSTNGSFPFNREAADHEPFAITRLTEMGVVT